MSIIFIFFFICFSFLYYSGGVIFDKNLLFIIFCIFSYGVPFWIMSLIFDKREYLRYSLLYIYIYISFNFIIFLFVLAFSASNMGDAILSFIPPAIFWLFLFSLGCTSLYSFVFLVFQPIFSILFLFSERKSISYKKYKYSRIVYMFVFIFYLIAPDIYFIISRKLDNPIVQEDCFILKRRDSPLFHTMVDIINKKKLPFVDRLPPSNCK